MKKYSNSFSELGVSLVDTSIKISICIVVAVASLSALGETNRQNFVRVSSFLGEGIEYDICGRPILRTLNSSSSGDSTGNSSSTSSNSNGNSSGSSAGSSGGIGDGGYYDAGGTNGQSCD